MNKILKAVGCVACAFVLGFLAVGYALVQDELQVSGSLSVEGEPLLADNTFVFDSNYLKAVADGESIPEYTVYGKTVDIVMFNHDGLEATGETLDYKLSIIEGENAAFDLTEGTLAGGTMVSQTHTLTYKGDKAASITVTATSSNPQKKELKARFKFIGDTTFYTVKDNGTWIVLDIYTGVNTDGLSITVDYGTTLAPDNTNEKMTSWVTADKKNQLTGLSPNSHYEFVFFENSTTTGNEVAEEKPLPEGNTIVLYTSNE